MIRPGLLDSEARRDLIELARDGSAAYSATISPLPPDCRHFLH
jgi:hypothetical protein